MQAGGKGAGRGWLHVALAAAATAGLLALVDGWFQPDNPQPLLRLPVMAFSVLGAWLLLGALLAAAWLPLRRAPPRPSAGLAFGVFAGGAPLLFGLMPGDFASFRIALAHLLSAGAAILVYFQARPGPRPPLCALLAAAPAAVLACGLALPRELPRLRSAEHAHDDGVLRERGGRPDAPPGAPDLVLVSVDTLRADAIFADPARPGVPLAPAPFLQGLSAQGALWAPYALSSSDQTLPGHVGMLAGMDAMAHGVRHNFEAPSLDLKFLAQHLREGGYRTAATIANGLIGATTQMDRGYDDFSEKPVELALFGLVVAPWLDEHTWIGRCSPKRWSSELFARLFFRGAWARRAQPLGERSLEAALAQAAELRAAGSPGFRFVHFMDPHTDYAPPPGWRGRLSAAAADGLARDFLPAPDAALHGGLAKKVQEALAGPRAEEARRAADYYRLVYLEEVAYVDDCLRRLVEDARAGGRPTVFLITADHGEMFGEHGLMEHANGLWEENLRVPFLLFGANVPAGEVPWVPQLDDVAPTLLTLAGLPVPPEMTGAPLLLPADGSRPDGSRAPVELRVAPAPQRAHAGAQEREVTVRAGGWKWTGAWDAAGGWPAPLRTADLAQDPFERTALADWPEALRAAVTLALARDTWARRERPAAGSLQRGLAGQLGYAGN